MSPEVTVREEALEPVTLPEEYFAFPLTPGQRAMLPANLDSSGDPRFNGAFRMNLDGQINCALLERSLLAIAQRHEIFRTVFREAGTDVHQVVHPHSELKLATSDLRDLAPQQQEEQLDAICLREAQTGFDLKKSPPLRVRLIQLSETKSMLVLTLHQVICDGWSIGIFMEEISKIYTAYAAELNSPLSPLEFQFGDYVIWHEEMAALPEMQGQRDYWKKRLADCKQLEVAPDYEAPSRSIRSDIVSELLPSDLSKAVKSLAQGQNTTFFVVSMAACMTLLHRYTNETDIALRTPLAGRTRVEFENLIGQFVNQVVVRSEISGQQSFSEVVTFVRERVWEALANQDIPFESVVEDLTGADPNNSFRVNFVCQREYGRSGPFQFELAGTRLTTLPSKSQGALYDLNFFLVEREVGWRLSLEYKTDLYSKETAESLVRHFVELFNEVTSDPNKKILDIALSNTEALAKRSARTQQATDSSEQASDSEQNGLQALPASFAQTRFWTLSEVDPENPSFHMPVTLRLTGKLSVSLLEKSFQLLIDRHETLRTSFAEIDGELMQVIHDESPFSLEVITIEPDSDSDQQTLVEVAVRDLLLRPFDLSKLPLFRTALYRLSPEEHILTLSIHHVIADAWSIQVFQRELWTAYENFQKNAAFSFEQLSLQYGDFSVWQRETAESEATQEHLNFWLKSLSGQLPVLDFPTDRSPGLAGTAKSSLETLLLPDELTQSLKQVALAHDTTLYVVTLACFSMLLSRSTDAQDLIVGSPVLNRRIETEPLIGPFAGPVALRLNLKGNPSLRDVLIATRDTTLEALGHTDLPFETLLEKLSAYPTGRRSPLFQFYFFCQPAFLQTRELQDLTIAPLPTTSVGLPFEMQLAVIERKEGVRAQLEYNANLFDASTIQSWLVYYQEVLASLTANLNQRLSELPPPPYHSQEALAEAAIPSTATTQNPRASAPSGVTSPINQASELSIQDSLSDELTALWKSALGIDHLGLTDNFFALGGRSLVAARLIARINKKYFLKLGLATFFNCPTIAQLAALIRGQLNPPMPSSIVAVQAGGSLPPLFMVHGVGGNVLNFYDLARNLGPEQPVYGVEAQALQSDAIPLTTLESLAAYYVSEVRKVQPSGPYNFLGYSFGGFVAFEMARQLQLANEQVSLLGMLDTPVWRHATHEEARALPTVGRQLLAVWTPFLRRLRPFTPMELFDATKSSILRTFYTFATSNGMVIPPKLRSVYHINSFAAVNYVPKFYDGAVTILRASREKGPRDLGWGRYTSKPARIFEIPGAHLQVLSNENLPRVVKSLQECLPGL